MSESVSFIADELGPMVTPERLEENAKAYNVMQLELTSADERRIDDIKARLLGMPLVHASRDPDTPASVAATGLHPHRGRGAQGGNTYGIDGRFGLDRYVFFNWGKIDPRQKYGAHHVVIAGSALLEQSLVTPRDIAESIKDFMQLRYEELTPEHHEQLDRRYFSTMVTGADWLEIKAREVFEFAKKNDNARYPFPVGLGEGFGEVKIYDTVSPTFFKDSFTLPEDFLKNRKAVEDWNNAMLEHGVAFDCPEHMLPLKERMVAYKDREAELFRQAGWCAIMGSASE
jgi:hypothetical protein